MTPEKLTDIMAGMIQTQASWGIIQVKVNRETEVKRLLDEAGFHVYLPLIRKRVTRFSRKLVLQVPMFPGYVFVQGLSDSTFNTVRYCRGVLRILGSQRGLWLLPDDLIAGIMAREVDGVVQLVRLAEDVNTGDPVVVTDGPFEGWRGIFQEHLADGERVRILLTHVRFSTLLVVPKVYVSTGNGLAIK